MIDDNKLTISSETVTEIFPTFSKISLETPIN